jgi:hypothetical protein
MLGLKLPKSRFGPQTRLLRTLIDEIENTISQYNSSQSSKSAILQARAAKFKTF